jgi:chromatin segregation and condensation protein Rec8/ScpA/Scc1 (kleisin family)
MIAIATENAQILSEEVKKKVKNITNKESTLVEVLDYILDVMRLALCKSKAIKEIQEDDKQEDEDIKEYVARVFKKVDRLPTFDTPAHMI